MDCKFKTQCGLCSLKSMNGLPYYCDQNDKINKTPEGLPKISTEELLKPLNKKDGEG